MGIVSLPELGQSAIQSIINDALSTKSNGFSHIAKQLTSVKLIGSLFWNTPSIETDIAKLTASRLDLSLVPFQHTREFAMLTEELLDEFEMMTKTIDVVLSAYVSNETFGEGRTLVERFGEMCNVPLVNVMDDLYCNPRALSVLSAFMERIGTLAGKRIAISWGFGTRFVLPSTAHSLLLLGAALGVNMRVIAPRKFSLLRRVVREASVMAKQNAITIEEEDKFDGSFHDTDAVFMLNWHRPDNFHHPERNTSDAAEFKDWQFSEETFPIDCVFLTDPPAQSDLIAERKLLKSKQNLTSNWMGQQVRILAALILYAVTGSRDKSPLAIL